MSGYTDLLNAIARAELIASTFRNVAESQTDQVDYDGSNLTTLQGRINEYLNMQVEDLRGDDGLDIINVSIEDNQIMIEYSDGTINTFDDVFPSDGFSIEDYTVDEDGNLIQASNKDNVTIGNITPDEALGITNLEVLSTGYINITYTDGSSEEIGYIGEFGDSPIETAEIVDDYLHITFGDGTTQQVMDSDGNELPVKGMRGESGNEFESVVMNRVAYDEVYLKFTMTDGSTFPTDPDSDGIGPVMVDVREAEPEDILRYDFDEETGELIFFLPEYGTFNLGEMHGTDGVDSSTIESVEFKNYGEELHIKIEDTPSYKIEGTPRQVVIAADDTEILDTRITSNRELVFEIGTPEDGNVVVNVGEVRGYDGRNMNDVTIDENGDFIIDVYNQGSVRARTIGNVAYNRLVGGEINQLGELQLNNLKGDPIIAEGNPDGDDGEAGAFVRDINFDPDNEMMLSLVLTDDTEINDIGITRPTKSHTVTRDGDDIIYTFDDGSTSNLGNLNGDPAHNVTGVTLSGNTITISYDDQTSLDVSNVQTIAGLDYSNSDSLLTFDYTDYTTDVDYERPEDAVHGIWVTSFTELSTGRLRANYNNGDRQILPGGTIHANWPEEFYLDEDNFNIMLRMRNQDEATSIGQISGFDGTDGLTPTTFEYKENGDILIVYNDDSEQTLEGANSTWITNAYNDPEVNGGDDILVQFNHLDEPTVVGTIEGFEGNDGRWITDMRINLNRNIVIQWNDLEDETSIDSADGEDGNWITSLTRDGDNIIAEQYRGSDITITGADALDGIEALWMTDMVINNDRQLDVTYSDGSTETIGNIDGEDATVIETMEKVDSDLVVTYIDGSTETIGRLDGLDFETEITNISIVDSKLAVTSTDGTTVESDVILRRLDDATITDGELELTFTNFTKNVGIVDGEDVEDGVYITNIEVENQELFVTYSDVDETRESLGAFDRVDFESSELIDGADNAQENLNLIFSDGSNIDLGRVRGDGDNTNIVDGLINNDGELVLTFSDDRTETSNGRVQGDHGLDIISSEINTDGELIFTLEDTTTINSGFVLQDLGFAPYDPTRIYDRSESCTLDGVIYVALEDGVDSEPTPDNSQWTRVRLQDDSIFPDASRPTLLSPINDETFNALEPYLLAGDLRNYYSVDTRKVRIFQIDLAENNFVEPVYEAEENLDGHQVDMTLTEGVEYKWRARDIVEQTGYTTDWSLEGTFTVVASNIDRPSTNIETSFDVDAVTAMPIFESSAYSGSGTHTSTVWQIKSNDTDEIVYELETSDDLESTMIPFAVLEENSDYSIRVQHSNDVDDSAFSSWLSFTTVAKFDIDFKPVVTYVGEDDTATTAKPYFTVNSFVNDFYEMYMDSEDLTAEWEVVNSLDEVVWTTTNQIDIIRVQVREVMTSGETFRIRVKYYSDRFFGESDWSDYVSFTPDWSIDQPTITTPYDVTEYPVDGLFESSEFNGVNEEHFGSVWEVRDVDDDSVQHSSYNSFDDLVDWEVSFGEQDSLREYYVVVKHLGRYGESDWSEPLNITMREIIEVSVYVASEDLTVRRLTNEGNLRWVNEDHTDIPSDVDVDDQRNVYSVGADNTIIKNDEFGNGEVVYTHDVAINSIAVNELYEVVIGTSDNLVIKFDETFNELWRNEEHTGTVNAVRFDPEGFVYSGSNDNTVKKIDSSGEVVWSFSGHTASVTDVDVDVNGNVYSVSLDDSVRKIDSDGMQTWVFDSFGGANVNSVSVNVNFNVFVGSNDSTARMIDSDGNEVWSYAASTAVESISADYLDRSYIGLSNGDVLRLSDSGEEVWTYTDINSAITHVTASQVPVLLKPTEFTGRYWNLVAPENLTAF